MTLFRSRLTAAFALLQQRGYFAQQNWQCCQNCGVAALPDGEETNFVFYTQQDDDRLRDAEQIMYSNKSTTGAVARAKTRAGVMLTWNGDGEEIRKAFFEAGLAVEWDGSNSKRIWVTMPPEEVSPDQVFREQLEHFIGTLH